MNSSSSRLQLCAAPPPIFTWRVWLPSQPSLRPTSLAPLCSLVWFCVLLVWCRHSYIPLPNFPLVKKELCMWFKVSKINMPRYMCALCVYAYVWLGDSMCLTHHRPSVVVRLCLRSYLRQVRSACSRAASVRWETRCWRHSSPSGLSSWPLTDHTHIHTHTYPPHTHTKPTKLRANFLKLRCNLSKWLSRSCWMQAQVVLVDSRGVWQVCCLFPFLFLWGQ